MNPNHMLLFQYGQMKTCIEIILLLIDSYPLSPNNSFEYPFLRLVNQGFCFCSKPDDSNY